MPPASPIEKRLYGCGYYNNYCNGGDGGLSYGGRVGIGIAIAVAVLLLVLALGFAARKRRMRQMSSVRPTYQTNQPAYQQQAYMPQTGYGYPSTAQPGAQQYGGGYPNQGGNANSSYPPPSGPPPTNQPEMVDGQAYAPPSQPPPTYQK
ncbi:hypothetical protein BDZ90DRAFT_232121 [Jaminaea rosea]|uniref:Uncharacterized protein n=1 Tax=Jaminaea rosea TaxID=1569628 RepID=A0A316USF8_9BASI|nr:hypothetical protein BDZ90DRAFT_232121 [Jaminaea rosea]PWN27718.1 hypothetical protein BDZ90DRAFT_232121 [Jaminaea rosea]